MICPGNLTDTLPV